MMKMQKAGTYMTQAQEAPERKDINTEEEETEETVTKSPEQHTKTPRSGLKWFAAAAVIAALSVFSAALGRYVRNNTTLLMKHTVQEGYLPSDDYQLIDASTGKQAQNIRSVEYNSIFNTEFSENQYITSRGIMVGSDWNSFVKEYGDYRAGLISADPLVRVKNKEPIFLYDMKVSDFDEQYVKTGIVNPNEYGINITFSFYTDGYNVLYTWDEIEQNRKEYYERIHVLNDASAGPKEGSFLLGFSIDPVRENGEYVYRVRMLDSSFQVPGE